MLTARAQYASSLILSTALEKQFASIFTPSKHYVSTSLKLITFVTTNVQYHFKAFLEKDKEILSLKHV